MKQVMKQVMKRDGYKNPKENKGLLLLGYLNATN
jgi:hypothetical protein